MMNKAYNEMLGNRESSESVGGTSPLIDRESHSHEAQASHVHAPVGAVAAVAAHHHGDVRQHEGGHSNVSDSFLNDGPIDSHPHHHHHNHHAHHEQVYADMHVVDVDPVMETAEQTHPTTEDERPSQSHSTTAAIASDDDGGVGHRHRAPDPYMPVPVGTAAAMTANDMTTVGVGATADPRAASPITTVHQVPIGGGTPHVYYDSYTPQTADHHTLPPQMQQEHHHHHQQHQHVEPSLYTTHHHHHHPHDSELLPTTTRTTASLQPPPLTRPTTSPTTITTTTTTNNNSLPTGDDPLDPHSPSASPQQQQQQQQPVQPVPLEMSPTEPTPVAHPLQLVHNQQIQLSMNTSLRPDIIEARKKMNELLHEQSAVEDSIKIAKQKLVEAQNHLRSLENEKDQMDKAVEDGAKRYTDTLLMEHTHWNLMYRKLEEYHAKHGNCDVKRTLLPKEKKDNPDYVKLGSWVGRTRLEARRPVGHPERIEPYKVHALNRLEFRWQPRESDWLKNYNNLIKYMAREGRGKMPTRRKDPLGVWCDGQINAYNKFKKKEPAYITPTKIQKLNDIGFVWDRNSTTWELRYEALVKFHKKHGHCRVPKDHSDTVLYRWVSKERTKYRNYKAKAKPCQTEEQWEKLKAIRLMDGKRVKTAKTAKKKRKIDQPSGSDASANFGMSETPNIESPPPETEGQMMDNTIELHYQEAIEKAMDTRHTSSLPRSINDNANEIINTDAGPTDTTLVGSSNVERNILVSDHAIYAPVAEGNISLSSKIEL